VNDLLQFIRKHWSEVPEYAEHHVRQLANVLEVVVDGKRVMFLYHGRFPRRARRWIQDRYTEEIKHRRAELTTGARWSFNRGCPQIDSTRVQASLDRACDRRAKTAETKPFRGGGLRVLDDPLLGGDEEPNRKLMEWWSKTLNLREAFGIIRAELEGYRPK